MCMYVLAYTCRPPPAVADACWLCLLTVLDECLFGTRTPSTVLSSTSSTLRSVGESPDLMGFRRGGAGGGGGGRRAEEEEE